MRAVISDHRGELRHHEKQEEQQHRLRDQKQEDGIAQSGANLGAHLFLFMSFLRDRFQRALKVAGRFRGSDHCDQLGQCGRGI
jgi:hypothetical protein